MKLNWVKIGDICTFVNGDRGINYPKIEEFKKNGIPFINAGHIQNNKIEAINMNYISRDKYDILSTGKTKKGDVLYCLRGSLGKHAIIEFEFGAVASSLVILRPDINKIISKYLLYVLDLPNIKKQIAKANNGSSQPNLSASSVKNFIVPLPQLEQQGFVIDVLDKAQELIDKRKEQIAACDELIKSLFYHMFGDPINSKKYKYERMKNVVVKLTDGTHKSPSNINKGIPYITAKHLGSGRLNFYASPTYISVEEHEKIFSRCNPAYGDVLYIKDGATTGIAAINIYDFEFSMLSSLALIKTKKYMLNEIYLVNYLNNERVKNTILQDMAGGAIKRLTLNKINQISIMLPPIDLQNDFAKKIEKIEQQKQLLAQSLTELENNFSSLMQRAFKGELF